MSSASSPNLKVIRIYFYNGLELHFLCILQISNEAQWETRWRLKTKCNPHLKHFKSNIFVVVFLLRNWKVWVIKGNGIPWHSYWVPAERMVLLVMMHWNLQSNILRKSRLLLSLLHLKVGAAVAHNFCSAG